MSDPNGVMMQYCHWYLPADGTLWNQVAEKASELATTGITSLFPQAILGVLQKGSEHSLTPPLED